MGEEYITLLFGEFLQSILKLRQQHRSGVGRLRSGIAGREQVLHCEEFSLLRYYWIVRGRLGLPLAKQVCDSITRDAEQPRADLLDGLHQAVRFYEFVEDLLQDVFRVARVGDTSADKVAEPSLVPINRLRDPLVLIRHHPLFSQRLVHLLMETNERDKYFRGF